METLKQIKLTLFILLASCFINIGNASAQDTEINQKTNVEELVEAAVELKDLLIAIKKGESKMTDEEIETKIEELEEKIENSAEKIKENISKEETSLVTKLEEILSKMDLEEIEEELEEIDLKLKEIDINIDNPNMEIEEIEEQINNDSKTITKEDNSIKVNLKSKHPAKQTRKNFVLGFGPNVVIENQNNTNFSPDINPWNSWSGYLGYQFATRFSPTSKFGIQYGLLYKWYVMGTKGNARVYLSENEGIYINDNIQYTKSKLRSHYFAIPLMLQISNHRGQGFVFGIGGYAGLRLGDTQKLKFPDSNGNTLKSKIKSNFKTNPYVYGLGINAGSNFVRFYLHYDLSNVWRTDINYDWNRVNFGFHLVF